LSAMQILGGSVTITAGDAFSGTSLTIAAGTTLIFDPSLAAGPVTDAASDAGAVSAGPLAAATVTSAVAATPRVAAPVASVSAPVSANSVVPIATDLAIQQLMAEGPRPSITKADGAASWDGLAAAHARDVVMSERQGGRPETAAAWIFSHNGG